MILIGQYDSPFVRRLAIALQIYGLPYEHRPLSVFGDGEAVRAVNPLMRMPALVLNDGCVLTDSHHCLDHLDRQVSRPMFPRRGPTRDQALRVAALACGLADKAVSLFYELRLHPVLSPVWEARCRAQIASTISALEAEREIISSRYWFGKRIGHADIAVACAFRFLNDVHPDLANHDECPSLTLSCLLIEEEPAFKATYTPFAAPAQVPPSFANRAVRRAAKSSPA